MACESCLSVVQHGGCELADVRQSTDAAHAVVAADTEFELGARFFPRPRCMFDTQRRDRVETLPSPFVS